MEGFLCRRNVPNFSDICLEADQNLFGKVLYNREHVLHQLLPPVSAISHSYSLRTLTHNRQLPDRLSGLANCNFITRMLFYQSYWQSSAFIISFTVNDVNNCVFVCSNAVYIWLWCCNCCLSVINKRICYVILWYIISQAKSCRTGQRPQRFVRGVRQHAGYSRARCSYRRAVDANFSFSTPPGKSLYASLRVDSLPESKLTVDCIVVLWGWCLYSSS